MYIIKRSYDYEWDFNWVSDFKQERTQERLSWIVVIKTLHNQVITKTLSYIKLIMKKREVTFHDEHENMFDIS